MSDTNINVCKVYHIVIFFLALVLVLAFLIFAYVFHDISYDKAVTYSIFVKIKGKFSYSSKTFILEAKWK